MNKSSPNTLFRQAEQRIQEQSRVEPGGDCWGLFTEQARFQNDEDRQGFFLWFDSPESLLTFLPWHGVYWSGSDKTEKECRSILSEAKALVHDFAKDRCSREDLLFRLNNLFVPGGMELRWMGAFSELLFCTCEIPRRTRLFCRRTLADMEEHDINPLDDSPLHSRHLQTFIECLGDFGLEGQGLNTPLPPTNTAITECRS